MVLTESDIAQFRAGILREYRESGRSFPWRLTDDPWHILVSEVMLQQTRSETVLARWGAWTERFPDPASLASAPLSEVLTLWKGLGYNRRALALKNAAASIVDSLGGAVPRDERELLSLPGVGTYTARAVRAFAFGEPGIVLETNIRAVFLFYFFPDRAGIRDKELEPYIEATLMPEDPRTWYYALMDYGAALKRRGPNPGRRGAAYARQSRFEGSHRQVRAVVLHTLAARGPMSREALKAAVLARLPVGAAEEPEGAYPLETSLNRAVEELCAEGFLGLDGAEVRLR